MKKHSCEYCIHCNTGNGNWCSKQKRELPDYNNSHALTIENGCMYHEFIKVSVLTGKEYKEPKEIPEWAKL